MATNLKSEILEIMSHSSWHSIGELVGGTGREYSEVYAAVEVLLAEKKIEILAVALTKD